MKRGILIGAALAVAFAAALGAVYGPELWAAYRFYEVLDRQYADGRARGGAWPRLQASCAHCHGPDGRSRNAHYPSLAGLSEPYLAEQLRALAEGRRRSPQMSPLAASMTEEQIKRLAAYYARQRPVRNPDLVADAALEEQGQATVAANGCAVCHGERLSGTDRGPLIAGQGTSYLADQLMAYKRGERQDPTQAMQGIASAMSEEEIRAAARHIAGLDPAKD